MIAAKNEGIFALIDMIDFFCQKAIWQYTGKQQEHPFYDFNSSTWKESKIKIYIEVDDQFE